MKDFTNHIRHYTPLIGVMAAAIVGFLLFPQDTAFRLIITIAASIAYVAWGIVHHLIHKDLHFVTILEYLLIALLGIVLVFSILLRV